MVEIKCINGIPRFTDTSVEFQKSSASLSHTLLEMEQRYSYLLLVANEILRGISFLLWKKELRKWGKGSTLLYCSSMMSYDLMMVDSNEVEDAIID